MYLFNAEMDSEQYQSSSKPNLLPRDGETSYFGKIYSQKEANDHLETLLHSIEWQHDEVFIFGKKIVTKREVAWYGDREFEYTYSKITRKALMWAPELLAIKSYVEESCGETFNSCLLNLYHTGEEGMGWHSDAERDLKKDGAIASLSFGAERKFVFKHKRTKQTVSLNLENGSLLIMKGATQRHWLHHLPPTKKVQRARINLTFRTIIQ